MGLSLERAYLRYNFELKYSYEPGLVFVINPFYLEDNRSCSIRTAGYHFILLCHPAFHYGTAL